MAYSLVANIGAGLGVNGGTTGSINTTGADLIVVNVVGADVSLSLSDSKGNTYTPLTAQSRNSLISQLFYVQAPTVGSGHTFTVSASSIFAAIQVTAWSGSAASPFDVETGATGVSITSLQTGSLTPGQDNELLVTGLLFDHSNTVSIDLGFTISDQNNLNPGNSYGGAMAYLVETSAAAKNPNWSWSTGGTGCAPIAAFKAVAAAGPTLWSMSCL